MTLRIRDREGELKPPQLGVDTVWNVERQAGEWVIADNMLQHDNALYSAVVMCMFTDARLLPGMKSPDNTDNKRGWWGTSESILLEGEFPFGSWLWVLDRSVLTDATEVDAYDYTELALKPLIKQKVVAEIKVNVTSDRVNNRLNIGVDLYSHKTNEKQQLQFNIWWRQTL